MSHRIRNRIGRRKDRNVEDLEWDEYEMGERSIPPPISELNGWQFSTDDEQVIYHCDRIDNSLY